MPSPPVREFVGARGDERLTNGYVRDCAAMKRKTVELRSKMQRDYVYELVVAPGRGLKIPK